MTFVEPRVVAARKDWADSWSAENLPTLDVNATPSHSTVTKGSFNNQVWQVACQRIKFCEEDHLIR